MLYECNYPRLLVLKYLPLILAFLILTGAIRAINIGIPDWWQPAIILLPLSGWFFYIFWHLKDNYKFVVIGQTKILIKIDGQEKEFSWLDVEGIKLNRITGVYILHIKDMDTIYFTAYGTVSWIVGDLSDMGVIISKMKSDFKI